jgi:exosortase A
MHADVHPSMSPGQVIATRERVRATLLFSLIVVSILAIMWPITRAMVDTWEHSATYGHCYVVIPVAVWMAWRESAALAFAPLKPFWPGLAVVAAVGFIGLLGELASTAVVMQFAAVGMAVATALTVFGRRWAYQLAFPLGFLFFAVPFGDGLLPLLMEWTADVTVWALRVTGIPVYREGNYFVVPSGSWSIIEACGGVRFLIAALMTGCIFAWLQYRAPLKRFVFVCFALAAALLANWLRAYAIVLMGHFSDNTIGTGADHNWWGWLIFGAAMFALFSVGMRWTDKKDGSRLQLDARGGAPAVPSYAVATSLAASLLLVAAWPAAAARIESHVDTRPVVIEAIAPRDGWQWAPTAAGDWTPELVAPAAVDVQIFVRDGIAVGVYRAVYRNQRQGAELVHTTNQIVSSESKRWRLIDSGTLQVRLNGEPTLITSAAVRGATGQFLIWHWYWLEGRATSSNLLVKLQLALQRLTGASDTAAWVGVYTPVGDDVSAGARRLSAFVEDMSGQIDVALETTTGR